MQVVFLDSLISPEMLFLTNSWRFYNFDCSKVKIGIGKCFNKISNFNHLRLFLVFSSKYWKLGFSPNIQSMFNEGFQSGNIRSSSKTTFSDILSFNIFQCKSELSLSNKFRFQKYHLLYIWHVTLESFQRYKLSSNFPWNEEKEIFYIFYFLNKEIV